MKKSFKEYIQCIYTYILTQTSQLMENRNVKFKECKSLYADKFIETGYVCFVSFCLKTTGFLQWSIYMRKVFYRCKQDVLLLTAFEVCLQWNGPSLGFAMSQYTGSVVEESLVTMEYRDCWVSVSSGRSLYWASRFVMEIGWNSVIIYQISKVTCIQVESLCSSILNYIYLWFLLKRSQDQLFGKMEKRL